MIDGAVRDSAAIVAGGFPVFPRGECMKGTGKTQPGRMNVPILCGETAVRPGDIVVGDRDGVMVIPAAELAQSLATAVRREEKEAASRQALADGRTTVDLHGLRPLLAQLGFGASIFFLGYMVLKVPST